jgi:hypothetical protein
MPVLFAKTLVQSLHIRSFEIHAAEPGWITFEREDERILHERRHSDWHRVERTKMRFMHEIDELRRRGWVEATAQ